MYDLVIRNGRIVDGSGLAAFNADIGVSNGRIAKIGRIRQKGAKEIDASGCIVTPGFVDGHTHMDAQVNWDPMFTPSCWQGVTSIVMGNCGFTLAPVRKGLEDMVVQDLERAEDISRDAMAAGIHWDWQTYPEYLDKLEALPKALNCAVNIGHSAVRTYVMGERALSDTATPAEIEEMRELVRGALRVGAIGFTTSRGRHHVRTDNRPVASRQADWAELEGIVSVLGEEGQGIFEVATEDSTRVPSEEGRAAFRRYADLSARHGVPIALGMPIISKDDETSVLDQLKTLDQVNAEGGRFLVLTHSKGFNIMLSFETQLPFDSLPVWRDLRSRPLSEQAEMLRDPQVRARLIEAADAAEEEDVLGASARSADFDLIRVYDREAWPLPTVAELARARNQHPVEVMIDMALERDLKLWFVQFLYKDTDLLLDVLKHPMSLCTFGDAGAHVGQVADFNMAVHFLSYWVKQRKVFSIEKAVQMITEAPARAWGFHDRGVLREGMAADINVIDFDRLQSKLPELARDLPGGARRIIQRADGIRATVVNGEVILEDGAATGARPGRLLRAGQMAANA